jgi:hydroxymethylpyrimidine/phosphomethylpyrimidine kinase
LSSAIAARIATGSNPREAIGFAKDFLTRALASARDLSYGSGHGPVDHIGAGRPE